MSLAYPRRLKSCACALYGRVGNFAAKRHSFAGPESKRRLNKLGGPLFWEWITEFQESIFELRDWIWEFRERSWELRHWIWEPRDWIPIQNTSPKKSHNLFQFCHLLFGPYLGSGNKSGHLGTGSGRSANDLGSLGIDLGGPGVDL